MIIFEEIISFEKNISLKETLFYSIQFNLFQRHQQPVWCTKVKHIQHMAGQLYNITYYIMFDCVF